MLASPPGPRQGKPVPRMPPKPLYVIVLAGLLLLSGMATATHPPGQRPALVLNTAASDPLGTERHTGFIDRLLGIALERLGYRLEIVRAPAERALILANSGVNDGEMVRIGGLSRLYPNLVQVTEPLITNEFVGFTRNPSLTLDGWQDLADHPVAIITGWKIFERNIPPGTELVTVRNVDQLFTLLQKDRTEIALYSRWSGLAYVRNHGLLGVRAVEPPLARRDMYVYLHKRHRDLATRLAAQLRALKTDGTYRRLFNETLAPYDRD